MRHYHPLLARVFVVSWLPLASGAAWADTPPTFAAAVADFELGRGGDGGATERASNTFRVLSDSEPRNPTYLAYYGASLTVMARDAWAPWTKMKLADRGLALIDDALRMLGPEQDRVGIRGVPVSMETRLIAASTFLGVPAALNRLEAARTVVAAARTRSGFGSTPASVRASFEHLGSQVARRDGDGAAERASLLRALELWPEAPFAASAHERLKELSR